MKKIVIFSALAMFALGAVVGRASVPAPVAPQTVGEVFSPAIILVNQNLPVESFDAI
jgi:hypothetical protein